MYCKLCSNLLDITILQTIKQLFDNCLKVLQIMKEFVRYVSQGVADYETICQIPVSKFYKLFRIFLDNCL